MQSEEQKVAFQQDDPKSGWSNGRKQCFPGELGRGLASSWAVVTYRLVSELQRQLVHLLALSAWKFLSLVFVSSF